MKNRVIFVLSVCLLIFLSSCKFQKILKNGSVDEKYEKAVKLYDQKDYSRALQLFDQLAGAMRATDKAQKIAYYYAYSYYNQGDLTLAAYYFKRYAASYPSSPEAEECMFMSAYCNYQNSPVYSLDQTITYEALKELQLFTSSYPASKRMSECNDLIDQLRLKLEMKDYRVAKMYYRMQDFSAATTVLSNILKDYPETPHKEEILYLIAKAYHRYAKQSVLQKKKERYTKALLACNEFAAQFPNSKYLNEVTEMKVRSEEDINSGFIKNQNKVIREDSELQLYKPKK